MRQIRRLQARPHSRPARHNSILTLLTDFGDQDGFVGQMKGVILGICPGAQIVDLTHVIPPQDIRAGAMVLERSYGVFPAGTVHVCVVDPGVGSERLPIAVRCAAGFFIAPDNGVLTSVLKRHQEAATRAIEHPQLRRPLSSTFHGRDLFAVAAAKLAAGFPFAQVGPVAPQPVLLEFPRPHFSAAGIRGEIIAIDHFGNAATNITGDDLEGVRAARTEVVCSEVNFGPVRQYYSQVPPGTPIALLDSAGRLELAIRGGSATTAFGLTVGTAVELAVHAED